MTTNEIEKKPSSKAEFIATYMVNRGETRWIRSIFFDEKDKIEAILDCMDRMTAKHEEEKAAMVREIRECVNHDEHRAWVSEDAVKYIAGKYKVELSKTDVKPTV